MEQPNLLCTPEISRVNYQKRHSLNVVDEQNVLNARINMKRPASTVGLPKVRSNSSRRLSSFVFRVVVIGSKAVGKTSLVRRYVDNEYSDFYSPTVSDVFEKTLVREQDDAIYMLRLYDTAGDLQYEFPAMFALTITEGDMFVMVYSVESRKSFNLIQKTWAEILDRKEKEPGDLPAVLVGNKSDVSATRRAVSEAEGQALADAMKCPFLEASAKTDGKRIEKIYDSLLEELNKNSSAHFFLGSNPLILTPDDKVTEKRLRSKSQKTRKSLSLGRNRKSLKSHCSVM